MIEEQIWTKAQVVAATAVALTFDCGFIPKRVKIHAYSSPTVSGGKLTAGTYVGSLEWNDAMANASGNKILANGTGTFVTTNGVTPSNSNSGYIGFGFGIETSLNVANYGLVIEAQRA